MGYALYVQDNIKENDYFRTTTGEIFQVAGVKEGKVYYAFGEHCWVDSIAITNFQENIIDLIEVGDYVNGERILDITGDYIHTNETDHSKFYLRKHIKTILTKEQMEANQYVVKRNMETN